MKKTEQIKTGTESYRKKGLNCVELYCTELRTIISSFNRREFSGAEAVRKILT